MLPGTIGRAFLAILIALLAIHAHAAGPLTAEIKPVALRPRAMAPEVFEVKLTWAGGGVLEGALELTFSTGDDRAPRCRTHDLALTPGTHSFRLMTPAPSAQSAGFSREIVARFITKNGVLDAGRFEFARAPGGERAFSICVSTPETGRVARDFTLWHALRLENFPPKTTGYSATSASTLPVFVETGEMPASALGCTPYDIVLLEDAAFTALREKQLVALMDWTLAGGSLCVKTSVTLEAGHRRFLAELLAAGGRGIVPEFGADGRLELPGNGGVLLARAGFGRVVLAAPGPQSEAEADAEGWKRASMFLWKIRPAQMANVLRDGAAGPPATAPSSKQRNAMQRQLSTSLAPKNARLVPFSIVVLVLGGFILAIGPLDWFVLGRLRRRRWTWLTFPLAAVAFSYAMILLAESYMGRHTQRRALTVTDLGIDGRVLRESRFEMIFPARNQEVTTEVRHALCVPVGDFRGYSAAAPSIGAPQYAGLFPARYTVRQSLAQWTMAINRLTTIGGDEDRSGLAWEKLDPRRVDASAAAGQELYTIREGAFAAVGAAGPMRELIELLSIARNFGWPGICTHFSPNGAAEMNDLILGAGDEPDVFASIVARSEGDGLHIYRHLYAP